LRSNIQGGLFFCGNFGNNMGHLQAGGTEEKERQKGLWMRLFL